VEQFAADELRVAGWRRGGGRVANYARDASTDAKFALGIGGSFQEPTGLSEYSEASVAVCRRDRSPTLPKIMNILIDGPAAENIRVAKGKEFRKYA
jgi:hypothetical protein